MFIKCDVALNENRIFQHECVWITHLLMFWCRDWGLVFIFIKCFLMWKPTSFLYYLRYQTLGAQPAPQVRSGYSSSKKKNNLKSQKLQKERFIQCCPHWKEGQRVQQIPQSVTGVLKWDRSLNYGPEICVHISCPGKGVVLPVTDHHCLSFIFIL